MLNTSLSDILAPAFLEAYICPEDSKVTCRLLHLPGFWEWYITTVTFPGASLGTEDASRSLSKLGESELISSRAFWVSRSQEFMISRICSCRRTRRSRPSCV